MDGLCHTSCILLSRIGGFLPLRRHIFVGFTRFSPFWSVHAHTACLLSSRCASLGCCRDWDTNACADHLVGAGLVLYPDLPENFDSKHFPQPNRCRRFIDSSEDDSSIGSNHLGKNAPLLPRGRSCQALGSYTL